MCAGVSWGGLGWDEGLRVRFGGATRLSAFKAPTHHLPCVCLTLCLFALCILLLNCCFCDDHTPQHHPTLNKTQKKQVAVVGVGGVGSVAAEMLTRCGIGRLLLYGESTQGGRDGWR